MIRACLSLLAGMYALQLSSFNNSSDYLNLAFVAAALLLFLRRPLELVCFCTGTFLFWQAAAQLVALRIPHSIAGDSIVITAEIDGYASRRGASASFVVRPIDDARLPDRIRLSWFEPPVNVHNGDRWNLEVRLRRPRGNRNPGGFDYEGWLFRERIAADGYVVNSGRNRLLASHGGAAIERIRSRIVSRIVTLIDNQEHAAVLAAIVVGSRHLVSREQWQRFAATGSSHLMAISGLHIGLAAAIAFLLCRSMLGMLRLRFNIHSAAVIFSMGVAMLYAQLAGFAVPARRASLMLLLVGGMLLLHRRPQPLVILSAACIALAIADPIATMAPGFMLSFAAVAILIWIARRRGGLVTMQHMLLMGLAPLSAMLFDRVSLAAMPVNLVAVPLFSFVTVPLSLLGVLLDGPLQVAGDVLLRLAAGSIAMLDVGLRAIETYPWASFGIVSLLGIAVLYAFLPVLWVVLPPGWPGRHLAWVGLVALLLYRPTAPDRGCVEVAILDVGQGLSIVARTQRKILLYDTGPSFRNGGSAAANVVLPYLRSRGIRAIDYLFVSHADLDHAGGLGTILQHLPVGRIYAGERLAGIETVPCRAGQEWLIDDVSIQVMHPDADDVLQGNDRSCVLLLQAGRYAMLLSGDIEKYAEHSLVRRGKLSRVDALIVPHHGSRTSSSAAFVQALRPAVAIVSAAHGNRWGLPKPDVVGRWQAAGAEVIGTANGGSIDLRFCAKSGFAPIRRYRNDNRRIWHE